MAPPSSTLSDCQRDGALPTFFTVDAKNRVRGNPPDIFYDAAGHTTRLASQNIDMEWDALGMQLVFKRQLPSFQQQVYIYGPGNLRILSFDSQDGALTWNQRDLRGKVLRTWRHTGSLDVSSPLSVYRQEKDYLYGLEGMFASRTAAGEERYFHSDHLGSPRAISNSLGQSVGQHHYYPFGHKVVPNAPYDDRFCKFTGHERDPNGGTDYMLGRTYAESFQRFLSVDPGRDGWNLYAYVGNNPVNSVDPTSLYICTATKEECSSFEEARQANLRRDGDIRATAGAFGDPGKNNGVTVTFGLAEPGAAANVLPSINFDQDSGFSLTALVTIDPSLSGTALEAVVGHEGQHVLDAQVFLRPLRLRGRATCPRTSRQSSSRGMLFRSHTRFSPCRILLWIFGALGDWLNSVSCLRRRRSIGL